MSAREPDCDEVALLLVDGATDPRVGRHVSSCLRCFRLASDLREVPRIEGLLRQGGAAPDPGEQHWAQMTAELGRAFDRHHGVRRTPVRALWRQVRQAFSAPLPAAIAGAAVAAALVLAVVGPAPAPVAPAPQPAVTTAAGEEVGEGVDDAPIALDQGSLWEALELPEVQQALTMLTAVQPAADEVSDDVTPAEEIEQLDDDELPFALAAIDRHYR